MAYHRSVFLILTASFAIFSTGCGFSVWPWGKRDNHAAVEPTRETKAEKCARLVRKVCDAAISIRLADMLELEGASVVGARGGVPNASAKIAGRASNAAYSASVVYVDALGKLAKLPTGLVDTQISTFAYQSRNRQELLISVKPLIMNHLKRSRASLPLLPADCIQDLQATRYSE